MACKCPCFIVIQVNDSRKIYAKDQQARGSRVSSVGWSVVLLTPTLPVRSPWGTVNCALLKIKNKKKINRQYRIRFEILWSYLWDYLHYRNLEGLTTCLKTSETNKTTSLTYIHKKTEKKTAKIPCTELTTLCSTV